MQYILKDFGYYLNKAILENGSPDNYSNITWDQVGEFTTELICSDAHMKYGFDISIIRNIYNILGDEVFESKHSLIELLEMILQGIS